MSPINPASPRSLHLIMAVGPVVLACVLGAWITIPNVPLWYAGLAKPPLTPPNWVFGPAWTILYALMAFSIYRILRLHAAQPARKSAIRLFYAQLALNMLWSFVFFGAHAPALGLVVIVALEILIAWMSLSFYRLDRWAGLAQLPYFGWVAFALWLNAGIWLLA